MANTVYHVGAGVFGIYAGTLNQKGDMWRNKNDVTKEALDAVAGYLLTNNRELRFEHQGKQYTLRVVEEAHNEQ